MLSHLSDLTHDINRETKLKVMYQKCLGIKSNWGKLEVDDWMLEQYSTREILSFEGYIWDIYSAADIYRAGPELKQVLWSL